MKIKQITAREILDSRAIPTIECSIILENGSCAPFGATATASVPSGASVGAAEAVELRDGDPARYGGKGVLRAIENITRIISPALVGKSPDVALCDKIMLELDGTNNKSKLGANAILAVSIAMVRAVAQVRGQEVYQVIRELFVNGVSGRLSGSPEPSIPRVMFNIINGGMHADNDLAFQEFMILPIREQRFSDSLRVAVSVYHALKELLSTKGYATGLGDEGGFAPKLRPGKVLPERQALDLLVQAVTAVGLVPGKDILFSLDVAASSFFVAEKNKYQLHGHLLTADELVAYYAELVEAYPIYSIEDGLDENDWSGWQHLTGRLSKALGNKVLLVGDDIFVSNPERILKGIEQGVANSVLIKPNQIGTVSECLEAIRICHKHRYKTVISHRSGETSDSFIADLAVGTGAGLLKAGAPARGERVAKYNRLLEIEPLL